MRESLEVLRWVTLHPALVHFPIGAVPVLVVAYGIGAWRKSERWTFAGDVVAAVSAGLTLVAFAFGWISNALVPWPGGIELWRWIHLGFGILSTALLTGLAAGRLLARRRHPVVGRRGLAAAFAAGTAILVTGWIGGEVLVFHSGVAVKAGASGALAPPISHRPDAPRNVRTAMGRARASWASVSVALASMVVEEPSEAGFELIARETASLRELAQWLATEGPGTLATDDPRRGQLASMAENLRNRVIELEQAAQRRDLPDISQGMGRLTAACIGCHIGIRWEHPSPRSSPR